MDTTGILPALTPLLTAAVGVERAIEIIWNYIEWALLSFLGWQPEQLKTPQYLQFKSGTSMVLGVILGILVANFMALRLFTFLGPTVPGLLDNVPATWDLLITGFLIGAGAKPAHDILGVITQVKNFLNNSAIRQRESAAAALAEGVLKLAQSEAQAMVDVPGVGPARLPMGGSARGVTIDEEAENEEEASATERYIAILHRQTAT
ncbi:MAG TPA: hypothetical protein P5121_31190 [Caldilineaceae bacterium]|nr:hypothetical protein [Caldilineaceae bacterium]